MWNRFFMRFNLYKSIATVPLTADFFKQHLNADKSELEKHLDEFSDVQNKRVEKLKASHTSKIEKLKGKKAVFLGDSITSDNLGYRTAVTKAAELKSFDCSVSGGTTSLIIGAARTVIAREKPDIISIMAGANDSVSIEREDFNQVSIEEYVRNMREFINYAKRIGAKILLFEITPVNEERFRKSFAWEKKLQSNQMIAKYNEALKKVANELDVSLISNSWLKDDDEAYFENDGIHLSIIAHEKFAEKWLDAAAELF